MHGLQRIVMAVLSLAVVGSASAAITDNLILYLPLDSDVSDQSGTAVPTTVNNSVTFSGAGIVGNAGGIFNSTGATPTTANYAHTSSELSIGTSDFSVSLWVNGDSTLSVNQNDTALISNKDWNSGSNNGWVVARGTAGTGGGWQWNFTTPAAGRVDFDPDASGTLIEDNEWHHIAVTHDRDGMATFFFDGAQIGSADISAHATGSIDAGFPTSIGTDGPFGDPWDAYLNGSLDEVAMWDRVVSSAEIQAIYDSGLNGVGIPSVPDPLRLTLEVNQVTGELTLQNTTASPIAIRGYSILSESETLNPQMWTSIADGGDANSGGAIDADDNWIEFTNPSTHGDLSEGSLGEGVFGPGQSFSLGEGSWTKFWQQDLSFEYIDGNGNVVDNGFVVYSGNNGESFVFGDLDFDGDVDPLDWVQFVSGLGVDFENESVAEAYASGDLNGDLVNNHDDFLLFQAAYDDANGAGAFAALIPEPSALPLMLLGFLAMTPWRKR